MGCVVVVVGWVVVVVGWVVVVVGCVVVVVGCVVVVVDVVVQRLVSISSGHVPVAILVRFCTGTPFTQVDHSDQPPY